MIFFGTCLSIILMLKSSYFVSGSKNIKEKSADDIFTALITVTPKIFDNGGALWSKYQKIHDILAPSSDYEIREESERTKLLLTKVDNLATDIQDFKNKLFETLDVGDDTRDLKNRLNAVSNYFTDLSNLYETFAEVVSNTKLLPLTAIKQFAKSVIEPKSGVNGLLNHIHKHFLDTTIDGKTVFEFFADDKLKRSIMYQSYRSGQQNINFFYQNILMHELYGYMMIILGNYLIAEFDSLKYGNTIMDGSKSNGEKLAKKRFYQRMNKMSEAAKYAMKYASRDVWRCDPHVHVEGKTYDRFGPVFQRYIMHEADVLWPNDIHFFKGCTGNCPGITNSKQNDCGRKFCTPKNKCRGNVRDCEYVHKSLTVCPANDGYRRYQFIETGDGQVLGPSHSCKNENSLLHVKGSFAFPYSCDFCVCTCEENDEKRKVFINLQPVLSDVKENKVITGMQFVNAEEVFHVQIQQGQLLSNGQINISTVDFKPIHVYRPMHGSLARNVDYYRIDWDSRTIYLSDRDSEDANSVVTGIRFVEEKGILTLAVQYSKFDYPSGKVDSTSSHWDSSVKKTDKIDLDKRNVPILFRNNLPISKSGEYLELTTSDLEKDAGQNVIPFLDIQPVITRPPVPISGAALHYKSERHSAGFLALKIFTYNVEPHLKTQTDSEK